MFQINRVRTGRSVGPFTAKAKTETDRVHCSHWHTSRAPQLIYSHRCLFIEGERAAFFISWKETKKPTSSDRNRLRSVRQNGHARKLRAIKTKHLRSKSECGRTRSTMHAWRWRRGGWGRGGGFTSSRQNLHLETWCMQTWHRKFKIKQQRWRKLKVVVFGESDDEQTRLLGEDWGLWFQPQKEQVCCFSAIEYGL